MKLEEAIFVGKECGIIEIHDCINYVISNFELLFSYDERHSELFQLYDEARKSGVKFSTACGCAIPSDYPEKGICFECSKVIVAKHYLNLRRNNNG